MVRFICLVIGYVFGLFQTAFIYGKMHGIDIREHGSGNAGTTNALRVLGRKAGLIVFVGDVLKTVFAILTARLIFGESHADMLPLLSIYAAAGAILGHNFPCYLKFKGGKGIAATAGLIVAFDWRITIVCAVVFLVTFLTTHYVSLGSLLVYLALVVGIVILGQMGQFQMDTVHLYEMYGVSLGLAVMAYIKHGANIQRLIKGEERKTYLSKKNREEKQ